MCAVTPEERAAILWITITALVGIIANYCVKAQTYPRGVSSINENVCKVNINTASIDELMAVKGVGEKLARRIIDYRMEKGLFGRLQDLMVVKGMTLFRFNKFKDMLIVE